MRNSYIVVILAALVALYASVFTVNEGERGVVVRFSKVVRDAQDKPKVYEPGLHFKMPFLDTVKKLDARIQTLDITSDRFLSREKKDLIVDSYLKWQIKDFGLYYQATGGGNKAPAQTILQSKLNDRLRSEIGRLNVRDIVTDSRGRLTTDVRNALNQGAKEDDKDASSAANLNSMAALGIEVVDVRIKQINLPEEVSKAIYQRMSEDRKADATLLRSQGIEKAVEIKAKADRAVTEIKAKANGEALILRGEGDAEATKLFADAFNQDPDFYAFIRSLRAYENSFKNEGNIMVLSPDTDFFRYMKDPAKQRFRAND
ncbi:MAG: protease modulator HflC [Enterobacteriaceae bacterium]|jgi:membrane protease subunit HflC|nr:protease modulator HflC [Enterobacteriaceae bacterium]